jgi:hypothetical protein
VLGRNGYLNLYLTALDQSYALQLFVNTVEVDPASGRIVSLRSYETDLQLGLLGSSVVEHLALSDVVRRRLGVAED